MWFYSSFVGPSPLENEITMVDRSVKETVSFTRWKGRTILIDVGGRIAQKWREKVAKAQSICQCGSNLDSLSQSLVLENSCFSLDSHTDQDHMGDMVEVAKQIPVKKCMSVQVVLTNSQFREKLKQLHESTIKVVQKRGSTSYFWSHHLEVLSPDEVEDGNDDSIVPMDSSIPEKRFCSRLIWKEAGGEKTIEKRSQLQVDVLKVGLRIKRVPLVMCF